MNDESIIELFYNNDNNKAVSALAKEYGTYCYNIAGNILGNENDVKKAVRDTWWTVKKSIPPARPANLKLYVGRIVRNIAWDRYTASSGADNISSILNELGTYISGISEVKENVISLQLSDSIDSFVRTLSVLERNIFVRRYFYVEAVADIGNYYGVSFDNVKKILERCLIRLDNYLSERGYMFSINTLALSFSDMGDDILDTDSSTAIPKMKKRVRNIIISAGAAIGACIGLVILVLSLMGSNSDGNEATDGQNGVEAMEEWAEAQFVRDGVVNINKLLSYMPEYINGITVLECVRYLDYYDIMYMCYPLENNDVLKYLKGAHISDVSGMGQSDGDEKWYNLRGHDDIQYIIKKDESEEYSLWEYSYVRTDASNDDQFYFLLYSIYGIGSADDIESLVIRPVKQDDLGDFEIYTDNYNTISQVYYAMSNMVCRGDNAWDLISEYPAHTYEEIYADSVQLTINTVDGKVIDNFYYSDIASCFYELNNGVAYSDVSENMKKMLYDIFYIGR